MMHSAGVHFLAGTDAETSCPGGFGLHAELTLFVWVLISRACRGHHAPLDNDLTWKSASRTSVPAPKSGRSRQL